MATSRDDIFRKSLALDPSDRAELVGLLIDSLDESVEPSAQAAWLEEISRRAQELEPARFVASLGSWYGSGLCALPVASKAPVRLHL